MPIAKPLRKGERESLNKVGGKIKFLDFRFERRQVVADCRILGKYDAV